jgi:hypothetical protein
MKDYTTILKKAIKEMMGMAGRVPSGGICVDTEEGTTEELGKKLPWSISESVKMSNTTKEEN